MRRYGVQISLGVALLALFGTARGAAQVVHLGQRSAAQTQGLALNAMTVTASPSTVNFTLASGAVSAGSAPISITTSWLLGVTATVRLYGFFSTSAALTSTGGDGTTIPVSSVSGLCATGSAAGFTPFLQTNPFGGASGLLIVQQSAAVSLLVTRTDQLSLQIDLTSIPQLPAGTYAGTLVLQAQAL